MAPNGTVVTGLLRQVVYYHLDNNSYENAHFFAERLAAHDPRSNESLHLLALSHFELRDYRSAYEVSKPVGYRGIHLGCAWVFAQSCLVLERFRDGINALEKSRGLWVHKVNLGKHTATSRTLYPDAPMVSCLLGKLYRAMGDKKKATTYFEDALKMCPVMMDAFFALCDMGVPLRVPNVFRVNEPLVRSFEPELGDASLVSPKDAATLSALSETAPKKPTGRTGIQEISDPFDQQRSNTPHDAAPFGNIAADSEENEFMTKINAARSRHAANSNTSQASEGMATPPGPATSGDSALVPRSGLQHLQEPPQAPARRRGAAQPVEPSLLEAPPKMGYRLGAKRREKPLDIGNEQSVADHASQLLRGSAVSTSATERKRTASGHPVAPRQPAPEEPGAPQRRSARLNMFKPSVTKTNSGAVTIGAAATRELKKARPPISRIMRPGSSGSTVGRVVSGNRKPPVDESSMDVDHAEAPVPRVRELAAQTSAPAPAPVVAAAAVPKPAEFDSAKIEEGLKWILDLLKKFGSAHMSLSQFQCDNALQILSSLPRTHQETPWVLALMGRAYYEQTSYAEAEKAFRKLRVLSPTRLEDMEVYSTILWFLKRETDLSFLAHELVDAAWHSPQAWCALGNAWSLAQDHEQALRCFKRATQLNPKFAYAYTLQGHEHVLNEEYDKALTAYRQAIAADRRHYNAYYGIGKVYEKLGNYDKAYTHYQCASSIHPTNAILICCLGTVLEKQKQIVAALQQFSKATDLAPRAAQTRFRKARALLAIGQLQAAQQELMILKDLAPDEARVHFLLGKLYKTMNDKSSAVRHFTIALSLDPKASQKIKEAIESLEDDDGFDDSMMP